MGLINPDFSEAVEVRPGSYPAVIRGSEVKKTKAGDKEYVAWTLEVVGSEDPRLNGLRLPKHNTMTSGKGSFSLRQLIRAVTGEDLPPGQQLETESLHGRELYVTVTPQKNNPQYMEVSKVAPYNDQEVVLFDSQGV